MKTILLFITALVFSSNLNAQSIHNKPIATSSALVSPLLVGQHIPAITVTQADSSTIKLPELLANKPAVLFFYRGGWCPFCNVQLGQLQAISNELTQLGYQLIGVSTDSPADLKNSIKEKQLDYILLSDYHSNISQAFGLAYYTSAQVTEKYLAKLKLANPLQNNAQNQARLVLPVPAVYIIDRKGLVQFQYVNPNYKVRLAPELLLHAAKLAVAN